MITKRALDLASAGRCNWPKSRTFYSAFSEDIIYNRAYRKQNFMVTSKSYPYIHLMLLLFQTMDCLQSLFSVALISYFFDTELKVISQPTFVSRYFSFYGLVGYVILALWPPVFQSSCPLCLLFVFYSFCFLLFLFFCEPKQKQGRGLVDRKLVQAPPSNFIAGRPKAALLFWFFGGFRCGVPYLSLCLLYINTKIGKHRCLMLD